MKLSKTPLSRLRKMLRATEKSGSPDQEAVRALREEIQRRKTAKGGRSKSEDTDGR